MQQISIRFNLISYRSIISQNKPIPSFFTHHLPFSSFKLTPLARLPSLRGLNCTNCLLQAGKSQPLHTPAIHKGNTATVAVLTPARLGSTPPSPLLLAYPLYPRTVPSVPAPPANPTAPDFTSGAGAALRIISRHSPHTSKRPAQTPHLSL